MMARDQNQRGPVEVVWEAPVDRRDPDAGMYEDAIAHVKKSPGKWARIRAFDNSSAAYNARARLQRVLTEERWEIRVARLAGDSPDRRGLYVRYRTAEQMEARPPAYSQKAK